MQAFLLTIVKKKEQPQTKLKKISFGQLFK
jgi:hypothetical protein